MLLNIPSYGKIEDSVFALHLDDTRDSYNGIPHKHVLTFTKENRIRFIVIYNSLAVPRNEIVSVNVATASVVVIDSSGNVMASQLTPVWDGKELVKGKFELSFLAEVPPLGLATYRVEHIDEISGMVVRTPVTLYNAESCPDTL